MLKRFWFSRFASSGGTLPGVTIPMFKHRPFVRSSYIGKPLALITGVLMAGISPAPAIITEVINAAGEVLPPSYVVQDGDKLRFKQTATSPVGEDVAYSGWVYAQQKVTDYTDLTPVPCSFAVALTSAAQPGSTLHYISSSEGYEPALAERYFWTGSAICDSSGSLTGAGGVPYGSNWRNPTGPIKPYRHMSACLPTNGGDAPGVRTGSAELGARLYKAPLESRPRFEKPDRWLFLRGDTFNCDTDLPDYQVFCPTFTPSGGFKLGTPGGSDGNNLRVLCDYGPSSLPRPHFIQPQNRGGAVSEANTKHAFLSGLDKNTRIVGLHFDGHTRDADYTGSLNVMLATNQYNLTSRNNGFEDCRLDGLGIGDPVAMQSQAYFFKGTITDCWTTTRNTGHIAGAHSGVVDPGIFQIFESLIARNGYRVLNPGLVEGGTYTPPAHSTANAYIRNDVVRGPGNEWYVAKVDAVPAGIAVTNNTYWTQASTDGGRRALGNVFDRNLYLAGRADMTGCVVLRGGSGEQWRAGGYIHDSFIQAGQVVISDWQLAEENENQTCCMTGVVIQNVEQVGVHVSTPLQVQLGCHYSLFENILCTFAQEGSSGATAIYMAARAETFDKNYTVITNRTRGNVIRNNLLHSGTGYAMRLVDGIWGGMVDGVYTMNPDVNTAVFPSLIDNRADDNDFIGTSSTRLYTSLPAGAPLAPPTNDAVLVGSTYYPSREAYAEAHGGVAPNRTLKTYLQSLGHTVASVDGVHEFVGIANTMDRFNWPQQYTAAAINAYIREGLGFGSAIQVPAGDVQAVVAGALGSIQAGAAGSVDIAASMGIALASIGGGASASVAVDGAMGGELAAMAGTLAASLGEPPNITFTALSTVRIGLPTASAAVRVGRTPARMAAKRIGRKKPP